MWRGRLATRLETRGRGAHATKMAKKRLKLVVLGMMARCPYGGQTWLYLNWLRALAAHGHEVWYVEDDPTWPYDPSKNTVTSDASYATKHLDYCMARVGLAGQWAYRIHGLDGACWGLDSVKLDELYASCDALLNIVGATDLREEQMKAPLRVYVETDPVTAELRLANGDEHTRAAFGLHDVMVTYAENYGAKDCGVPLCGLEFKFTRQPIDLELWPMHFDPNAKYFTTIGNYRQNGSDVEYNGQIYRWSKHHEWEKFLELPKRVKQPFELALNFGNDDERKRIESFGFKTCSPFEMSLDIFGAYPEYFRRCAPNSELQRIKTCACAAAGRANETSATLPRESLSSHRTLVFQMPFRPARDFSESAQSMKP